MFKVHATCPTRLDLAGGTLDLWPLYHQLPQKATVNLAIDLKASVTVEEKAGEGFIFESLDQGVKAEGAFSELKHSQELPLLGIFLGALWRNNLPALHIKTEAQSPKGAGLGGSSSLSIALCAALLKARKLCDGEPAALHERELVRIAQDVESSIIKTPTGCQDYWAAVRGGLNFITYPYGAVEVETLGFGALERLNQSLLVVYSGQSRASALNNWSVYRSFFEGEENTVHSLQKIGALAESCLQSFREENLEEALGFSEKEWAVRKALWPDIETSHTKRVDELACSKGALFTRVCGAGGGGVMSVFVEASKKEALKRELVDAQLQVLPAELTEKGLEIKVS